MILSKREKLMALAAGATVAVLVLDWVVLTPILDRRAELQAERDKLVAELTEAQSLFQRQRLLGRTWREMLDAGLAAGLAQAESQMLHGLKDWSQESGLALSSVKPGKVVERGGLLEMSFQAAGTGPMGAVARFLWRIETAPLPVRIQQVQLGARNEGVDALSLQVSLSVLCMPSPGAPATGKDDPS